MTINQSCKFHLRRFFEDILNRFEFSSSLFLKILSVAILTFSNFESFVCEPELEYSRDDQEDAFNFSKTNFIISNADKLELES